MILENEYFEIKTEFHNDGIINAFFVSTGEKRALITKEIKKVLTDDESLNIRKLIKKKLKVLWIKNKIANRKLLIIGFYHPAIDVIDFLNYLNTIGKVL